MDRLMSDGSSFYLHWDNSFICELIFQILNFFTWIYVAYSKNQWASTRSYLYACLGVGSRREYILKK